MEFKSTARRALAVAASAALALSLSGPASARPASQHGAAELAPPPPGKGTIEVVTVNGSGCPKGTAKVVGAKDNTSFTVTYSRYAALVGRGAKPTDLRKNCQLNIRVHTPQGFTYAVARADYHGFASLAKGATALQQGNYYFAGQSPTTRIPHNYKGPFNKAWTATDKIAYASLVWAPCGQTRNLNINTELRVAAGTSNPKTTTSIIVMDTTRASVRTLYHFAWKRC